MMNSRLRTGLLAWFSVIGTLAYGQKKPDIRQLSRLADSLYTAKQYDRAASYYVDLVDLSDFNYKKSSQAYNAACCFALQNKIDSAFTLLQLAASHGYRNKEHLKKDSDLTPLHRDARWKSLLASIPEATQLNSDPNLAKFVTDDVHHFWEAYDLVQKDTTAAYFIYKKEYFDRASLGMEDYMGLKVTSINQFITHIQTHPKLYQSIRANTLKADDYKDDFLKSFRKLKAIYPEAKFPDVYFVIGAFTSGGTVSPAGLLIGVNQVSKDDQTNLEELNFGQKLLIGEVSSIPGIISHELIHFQQDSMVRDTITLGYAIKEGMADFIGELISGRYANAKILTWVKGREKDVWERFTQDMYFNRYNNWIANYQNASEDNFPDLGYWIGYVICKSYYEEAADKQQAIYDLFHIKDYRQFLKDSKWEEKLAEGRF